MIGRLADCVITDLLVTELSFDASMCLIDVWLFDLLLSCISRETVTPDLQPGRVQRGELLPTIAMPVVISSLLTCPLAFHTAQVR